jgi:cyanophycin synthetase
MEFRKVLALRGPNIWANFPVLEAWVDLQDLKDSPSDEIPGFNDRLMSWLPTMIEHKCSIGERGGFFERLRRGTYQAHILEHVTLELQELAGTPVAFGKARETSEAGVYKVVIQYREEKLARACLEEARTLCLAAVHDRPFDVAAAIERLRDLSHDVCLGPSTASIVNAARARNIPVRRLSEGSLVQLGQAARQRRILTAETDRTGAIAQEIAQDKDLTRSLLRAVGVPVPHGRPATSPEDAWEAAQEIGAPVVVKPRFGNQGRGVTTDLSEREHVIAAYHNALLIGEVVVEQSAPGADYRLLVVGDRMVAAARREPAQVIGDGVSTIAQLVEQVNRDPRRSDNHATALSKIYLCPISLQVLTEQGYNGESVPPVGQRVLIRRNANLSTGGTAADVTDLVHPDVAARVVEAAQAVGLDIAGIDVVAQDISRPLEEQSGVIIEVNAGPGLRMHLEPSSGTPRQVGEAIIDMMFPPGDMGRIPVVAVSGVNGKTTVSRLVAHMFRTAGRTVGLTCTDGIYINNRRIEDGDCSGPQSARAVLLNPTVDAAVFETARGGILREGLGFDRCNVAIVTNIGEGDHLGQADIDTLEKLALVKRTIVDVVLPQGAAVLKADDPLVAEMAPSCKGSVIFFGRDGEHRVISAHRATGGRAVFVRDGAIVLADGAREIPFLPLNRVPLTYHGRVAFQVENVLSATAAAWAIGMPAEAIRAALESFVSDTQQSPGRFNVLESCGRKVVIDYAHNPSALEALIEALAEFPHQRRSIVYTAAGDRRAEDIVRQGEMLGHTFDRVHLYEDGCTRGRPDGEIIALLRKGLAAGRRVAETTESRGERTTVDLALRTLQPGDLLVVQPDRVEMTIALVERHLAAGPVHADATAVDAGSAPLGSSEYAAPSWKSSSELVFKD